MQPCHDPTTQEQCSASTADSAPLRPSPLDIFSQPQSERRAFNGATAYSAQPSGRDLPKRRPSQHACDRDLELKGKTSKGRHRANVVPSGTAINWISGLSTGLGETTLGEDGWESGSIQAEVTLSATGRMQGATSRGVRNMRMRYSRQSTEQNLRSSCAVNARKVGGSNHIIRETMFVGIVTRSKCGEYRGVVQRAKKYCNVTFLLKLSTIVGKISSRCCCSHGALCEYKRGIFQRTRSRPVASCGPR